MHLNGAVAVLAAGVLAGATSVLVAPQAAAAAASPGSIVVDCGVANGVSATTITGRVGDTFTITNTSGTGCTIAATNGIAQLTNLSGSSLPASTVSTGTILAAGTFTVQASGGTAQPMTVVIGDPSPAPEYTITFNANGGTCGVDAQSITAAANEWYAVPTDGTGPYQCHRDHYVLTGWSHGSTILKPGGEQEAPDLAVPAPSSPSTPRIPGTGTRTTLAFAPAAPWARSSDSTPSSTTVTHAMVADHETLYAVWTPLGVEITYDANVGTGDTCIGSGGDDVELADRSTEAEVFFAGTQDFLATSAPCAPVNMNGDPLPLLGWALSGDGAVAYGPGTDLTMTKFLHGTRQTLYAVWGLPAAPGRLLVGDENVTFSYEVDATTQELVITIEMQNVPNMWAGVGFHNFMFPADTLMVSFNATEGLNQLQYFDGYNPGIPQLPSFPSPLPDDDPLFRMPNSSPLDNQENWSGEVIFEDEEIRVVEMRRTLVTGDIYDLQFVTTGVFPACAAYTMKQAFDMADMNASQPTHQWYRCGVMYLER